jgi:hypothetical protein
MLCARRHLHQSAVLLDKAPDEGGSRLRQVNNSFIFCYMIQKRIPTIIKYWSCRLTRRALPGNTVLYAPRASAAGATDSKAATACAQTSTSLGATNWMTLVLSTGRHMSGVQDSMVIEYRGEVLRPALQDVKERFYQRRGMDVYLFALTESVLVDATTEGGLARFTNAACEPCLYSKILEVEGQPALMFFAKSDLRAGQEVTYDYRFRPQAGALLTPCQCGAPSCRGTLEV